MSAREILESYKPKPAIEVKQFICATCGYPIDCKSFELDGKRQVIYLPCVSCEPEEWGRIAAACNNIMFEQPPFIGTKTAQESP